MGSKGNRHHLKRLNTPSYFQIKRKSFKYLMKPRAGPHPRDFCLPLGHVIRDLLHLATNERETKYILNKKIVFVDGTLRTDYKFPLGLMDVIEIKEINKTYRVLPSAKHGLILSEITKDEAKFKLCRIENITTIPHGNLQLNLHDGRCIQINVEDPLKKPNLPYKTMGSIKISLPDQKILDYYPMETSRQALVFRGKNQGIAGKITLISKRFGYKASLVNIEKAAGEILSTAYEYTFVIGKEKPVIDLPIE
jgi:small subunit ribosomal protein S4e